MSRTLFYRGEGVDEEGHISSKHQGVGGTVRVPPRASESTKYHLQKTPLGFFFDEY
jgi:hypothetical protein